MIKCYTNKTEIEIEFKLRLHFIETEIEMECLLSDEKEDLATQLLSHAWKTQHCIARRYQRSMQKHREDTRKGEGREEGRRGGDKERRLESEERVTHAKTSGGHKERRGRRGGGEERGGEEEIRDG